MGGISGLILKKDLDIRANLQRMTEIIAHRGPDKQDFYIYQKTGFGYRGKAYSDSDLTASQPMNYLDRYTIVFDGNIYNYQELKSTLLTEGYAFDTNSDTEVILAAYDHWGKGCLDHFIGAWAFAILDKKESIIFCSRDRFGIKPLYYSDSADYFAFCSEIKQLSVLPMWQAKLDRQEAYEFLSWGKSHTNDHTFFANVKSLVGGSYLLYDIKRQTYFVDLWYHLTPKKTVNIDFESSKEGLYSLLNSSIKYCIDTNEKLCASLSGGIDSSTITVIVEEIFEENKHAIPLETISSVSTHKKYDESDFIKSVIESGNYTPHFIYAGFEDLVRDFDNIIWHQEEPFASAGTVAQWLIAKSAKEKQISFILDGQGADEILGGYLQSFGNLFLNSLLSFKISPLFNGIMGAKSIHGYSAIDIIRLILTSLSNKQLYSFFVNKTMLGSQWIKDKRDITLYPDWKKINTSLRTELIDQITFTKLPVLTHGVDRNTTAHSLESRLPFLDHRLVEYALALPDNYKINQGKTKYVLREAMRGKLPDLITDRHDKKGFITPEEIWVKQNPEFFLNEIKNTVSLASAFIEPKILKYFEKVISGSLKYNHDLFSFISFGRWLQKYNISI